jgi:hypothetical protein
LHFHQTVEALQIIISIYTHNTSGTLIRDVILERANQILLELLGTLIGEQKEGVSQPATIPLALAAATARQNVAGI